MTDRPPLPELLPGHHACCLYEDPEEHSALLGSFLRQGLERGEKVVYVLADHDPGAVVQQLGSVGLHVEPFLGSGQFAFINVEQAYLQDGRFDPDRMIGLLRAETDRALGQGYPAMRFKGETSWLHRDVAGAGRMIEYESRLSEFFPGSKCVAICPYDRRRFQPAMLLDVLTTHPQAVFGTTVYDNFYFMPASDFLGPDRLGATLKHWVANLHSRHETERHIVHLNQSLTARTAELEQANKELEAFAYSVSHDLRTPLRAIDGFSRILIQEHSSLLPEQPLHYLQLVRDNVEQMNALIGDLLRFSRISRQPLSRGPVDLTELVQHCLEELKADREGRNIELVLAPLPPCEADAPLLKQVWLNLLSNAFKYTRKRDRARVEIGCATRDGETVYFIKDNGVGFDMQYAGKLFGVFQRLHAQEEYEGTGIGLALVQRIIHRHGGRVWADAQLDQGATFYFTLPGRPAHA